MSTAVYIVIDLLIFVGLPLLFIAGLCQPRLPLGSTHAAGLGVHGKDCPNLYYYGACFGDNCPALKAEATEVPEVDYRLDQVHGRSYDYEAVEVEES